ncbi:MAG: hypothetical protein NVS2B16_16790 [Chloroflexota bacterium]
MQRNYHWFWPRAESKLYQEPKKLVALGLARADPGAGGRGKGTVYHITPAGRQALEEWVRTPHDFEPRLEFEAMVQVYAADHGTVESLLRMIREVREQIEAGERIAAAIGTEIAGKDGEPFPDRIHINALVQKFLWEVSEAVYQWTLWAETEVGTWDDMSVAGKKESAKRTWLLPSEILAERARRKEAGDQGDH